MRSESRLVCRPRRPGSARSPLPFGNSACKMCASFTRSGRKGRPAVTHQSGRCHAASEASAGMPENHCRKAVKATNHFSVVRPLTNGCSSMVRVATLTGRGVAEAVRATYHRSLLGVLASWGRRGTHACRFCHADDPYAMWSPVVALQNAKEIFSMFPHTTIPYTGRRCRWIRLITMRLAAFFFLGSLLTGGPPCCIPVGLTGCPPTR